MVDLLKLSAADTGAGAQVQRKFLDPQVAGVAAQGDDAYEPTSPLEAAPSSKHGMWLMMRSPARFLLRVQVLTTVPQGRRTWNGHAYRRTGLEKHSKPCGSQVLVFSAPDGVWKAGK